MGRVSAPEEETNHSEKKVVLKKEAWPPSLKYPFLFVRKGKRH
jgi:hypothetical protein